MSIRKTTRYIKELLRGILHHLGFDVVRLRHSHADMSIHMSNVFRCHEIDCVLDVGANRGQYGTFLRQLGFRGQIISFEPVGAVFKQLEKTAQGDDKWQCYNYALGDTEETKIINAYSSSVFSSFLKASEYSKKIWKSLEVVEPLEVRVVRLDGIFTDLRHSTGCRNFFLKMDTQGYDKNVFEGALGSLPFIRGLQSELSFIPVYDGMPEAFEVLSKFQAQGFQISGMYPTNRDESSMAIIEYDCVMVNPARTIA